MPKKEPLEREPSTGNVFADLGLADAGEHLIKAGLVVRIDRTIRQRKLTQAAAADLHGHRSAQNLSYAGGSVPGVFGRAPHAFPGPARARCRDRRKAKKARYG